MDTHDFGRVPEDVADVLIPGLILRLRHAESCGDREDACETVVEMDRLLRQPVG